MDCMKQTQTIGCMGGGELSGKLWNVNREEKMDRYDNKLDSVVKDEDKIK